MDWALGNSLLQAGVGPRMTLGGSCSGGMGCLRGRQTLKGLGNAIAKAAEVRSGSGGSSSGGARTGVATLSGLC